MMTLSQQYIQKNVSAEKAAGMVKSGDWIDYGHMLASPMFMDKALSRRVGELTDVKIRCSGFPGYSAVVMADPEQKSFIYNTAFMTFADRGLNARGIISHIPALYHEIPGFSTRHHHTDVCIIRTAPMDKNGFFNFGICNDCQSEMIPNGKMLIVEVNETIPRCLGGLHESVHISDVDYIVESDNEPLLDLPSEEPSENDRLIAGHIIKEIRDGACIQLGIGGMPNALGKLIAQTDLKDLGVHTEMMVDAYLDLYESGRVTNLKKKLDKGKMVYTFAIGSRRLYDFMDNNPLFASYPVSYTNHPSRIALNDQAVSINGCIDVDLFGQVSSESSGFRQISGTGGQFDFHFGSYQSHGGKSFVCMNSTRMDKHGTRHSNIRPFFDPGTIVTLPRTVVHHVVTEYGIAMLKGKSDWERADALIAIAHPDFRDSLIRQAEEMKIFTNRNRE
ncbi:MAG: 4-hydroxybutyrate CoA-transferase [Proteobacteria bacterium]|nr:4-hydroxybutyrate CoA-transferase [Pseudomonadota bacterium]